jgi:hypothetical protein
MPQIKIRYMVDEGDLINKPTHYVSVFKGYDRLVSIEATTKKMVKRKVAEWLMINKTVDAIIPKNLGF